MIKYPSKYLTGDVLDQLYKLYVRTYSDYDDIIYHHRIDPDFRLNFTNKFGSMHLQLAGHGVKRIGKSLNLGGILYTIEDRRWYQ